MGGDKNGWKDGRTDGRGMGSGYGEDREEREWMSGRGRKSVQSRLSGQHGRASRSVGNEGKHRGTPSFNEPSFKYIFIHHL